MNQHPEMKASYCMNRGQKRRQQGRQRSAIKQLSLILGVTLVVLLVVSVGWVGLQSTKAAATPNTWETKADRPIEGDYLAAAEIDGKLYAVGGKYSLQKLDVYDPQTDLWTTKKEMPTGRYGLAAAAINSKLYVVGGDGDLDVYDPQTDLWTTKAAMPTGRSSFAAAAINGKLYVIGGAVSTGVFSPHIYMKTLEVYDPQTDEWETKKEMPTGRGGLAAAAINGKLYVVGGYNGSDLNKLEVYDPQTDLWTTKAEMPTVRRSLAAAAINGKLYAVGGYRYLGTLEVYDPQTNLWTAKAEMPTGRSGLAAAAINGKLYAVGGVINSGFNTYLKTLEVYQFASDLSLSMSHTGDFTVGNIESYSLTVANDGQAVDTSGVITVTDTLPTGLSYVSSAGGAWNCSASGQTVTCANNSLTLAPGSLTHFTLNVRVGASTARGHHSIINTASVSATDEINPANNNASDHTTVMCQAITVTPPAVNSGTATMPFTASQFFTQTGGNGTITFSKNGALPNGMTLAPNGQLYGTPTQTGSFPITVTATDSNSCSSAQVSYTLSVNCPVFTATIMGGGAIRPGQSTTVTVSFSGGVPNHTVTLSNGATLTGPSPLSFTVNPATTTTYNITSVTDANGCPATPSGSATVIVDGTAPTITNAGNQVGVASGTTAAVSYPTPIVNDNNAGASFTCTQPSGANFPLGITTVTCTATDVAGNTAQCSFTVTVRTPRAAVTNLKTQVQALVPGTLTQTQANQMISHLDLASTRLEQGNTSAACTELWNFITKCNAFGPAPGTGLLNAAQRDNLVSYANKIRSALGCTGG